MDAPRFEITEADRNCLQTILRVLRSPTFMASRPETVQHAEFLLARHRYDAVTEALRTFSPLPPKPFFASREKGFPL